MYSQRLLEHFQNPRNVGDLQPPAVTVEVTNPIYQTRLKTLRVFHELAEKDKAAPQPLLGQIELGVPLPSTDPFATLPHGSPHGIGTSASHPC